MPMAEKILSALIKRNMHLKELSTLLVFTFQYLSGKLKRDNFSERELIEIADAMDCHFEGRFISNDNGEEV